MLEVFRESGIEARGIDLNEDSLALCRGKGLEVEAADLFAYLHALPDASLGGVVCSQVVEHLPPERLPELMQLAHAKLRTGAIAGHRDTQSGMPGDFCDALLPRPHASPSHSARAHELLSGRGRIWTDRSGAAESGNVESMPSLAELPEGFQKEFFGALDYAVFARKLNA